MHVARYIGIYSLTSFLFFKSNDWCRNESCELCQDLTFIKIRVKQLVGLDLRSDQSIQNAHRVAVVDYLNRLAIFVAQRELLIRGLLLQPRYCY
ncbi:hypothetical protein AU184_03800 [Mycolicibacterium novocastrense]|nr:hypothetical protein AU183_18130 [Mycolicibacterium novocastrense]KUH71725.1 hypothetical protein AU072_11045 [Mycolicibacterium novocastrense]KUH72054.1 hypothetical protein AU184_03800 [Mycolicibacterium novocastrense]